MTQRTDLPELDAFFYIPLKTRKLPVFKVYRFLDRTNANKEAKTAREAGKMVNRRIETKRGLQTFVVEVEQ